MTRIGLLLTPVAEVVVPWQFLVTVPPKASQTSRCTLFVGIPFFSGPMEELTRLQASRKAVKGHITRLHYKMDELLTGDFDDYTISSLTTAIEQIKKKGDRIAQMDERIAVLTDDATELE